MTEAIFRNSLTPRIELIPTVPHRFLGRDERPEPVPQRLKVIRSWRRIAVDELSFVILTPICFSTPPRMLGNPRFEIVRVDLVMVSMYKLAPFGSEFFFWSNIDYFELFHFPVLPAPPMLL